LNFTFVDISQADLYQAAYKCTPWDEIEKFEQSIKEVFEKFWIEQKASQSVVDDVLKKAAEAPTDVHKKARRSNTWKKMKDKLESITEGSFATKFPGKTAIAAIGVLGGLLLMKEVVLPSPATQEAWQELNDKLNAVISEAENGNVISQNAGLNFKEAFTNYLKAINAGDVFIWQVTQTLADWCSTLST
jgi:polyhydroxyalkanoate synthesis regulator phasin